VLISVILVVDKGMGSIPGEIQYSSLMNPDGRSLSNKLIHNNIVLNEVLPPQQPRIIAGYSKYHAICYDRLTFNYK
jgi:hypothetical protein